MKGEVSMGQFLGAFAGLLLCMVLLVFVVIYWSTKRWKK